MQRPVSVGVRVCVCVGNARSPTLLDPCTPKTNNHGGDGGGEQFAALLGVLALAQDAIATLLSFALA